MFFVLFKGMVQVTFRGLPNHGTMMVNPNTAEQQDFEIELPEDPESLDTETCLSGGPIGWTIHGVALYNPFTFEGNNAVEGDDAETFDSCQGHSDAQGVYHYHQLPDVCVFSGVDTDIHGIALDGFPIYGQYKEDGTLVEESELDKCHGRCGTDGKYRYHMTKTYPYILGCFRGNPVSYSSTSSGSSSGGMMPPPPGRRKRQTAAQCAYNSVQGDNYEFQTCSGTTNEGDTVDDTDDVDDVTNDNNNNNNNDDDDDNGGHVNILSISALLICCTVTMVQRFLWKM